MRRAARGAASGAALAIALAVAGGALAQTQTGAEVVDPGTIGGSTGSSNVLVIDDQLDVTSATQTDFAEGFAVSGDGSTLVGVSVTQGAQAHAFAWTASGGVVDLGTLVSGGRSVAEGVDGDGGVVVGFGDASGGVWHAFRWTQGGGMQDLGAIGGSTSYSFATGVSTDGSVVVGAAYTPTTIDHAFRWTQSGGMQDLGVLTPSGYSDAFAVSGDGTTVVGRGVSASGFLHAFRWTQGGGMVDLGTIAGAAGQAGATGVNTDGSVVVGMSIDAGGDATHAFRWTQSGGVVDLGTIGANAGGSAAFAVDGDGGVVVGSSVFGQGGATHAFVWTQATGIQDLNTLLGNAGVNMSGVSLNVAHGVSTNGEFIAGSGTFPGSNGATHAFLARVGGASSGGGSSGGGPSGVTTPASVLASIQQLAGSLSAQMLTNNLFSQVLLGLNEQISCGDCGGGYASFGSFEVSTHGRYSLSKEWTLMGGLSYGQYGSGDASVTSSYSGALALRFDPDTMGASRPYVEVGGSLSPSQQTTYTRRYVNGAGEATGQGHTSSSDYSAYASVGWVARLSPVQEVAASVDVTQLWQSQGGYAEASGAGNPFNAAVAAGTSQQTVVGLGAQLTRLIGRRLEVDLDGGVERTVRAAGGISATVAGAGALSSGGPQLTWFEAGGRLGYRMGPRATLELFLNATIGPHATGPGPHGGFGVSFDF